MSKHVRAQVRALPRRVFMSLVATCTAIVLVMFVAVWSLAGCDDASPTVAQYIAKSGIAGRYELQIGVYTDQPLVGGYSTKADPQRANDFEPGFETELAIKLAAFLGFSKDRIRFKPVTTEDRERWLVERTVDLVLASYSITQERKEKGVAFVGPYLITQPEVLVRRGLGLEKKVRSFVDLGDLGRRLCTEEESTSAIALRNRKIEHFTGLDTAKECIAGMRSKPPKFDAYMIDDTILAGYEYLYPNEFSRVNIPIGQIEQLGIGVSNKDSYLVALVANFLERSYQAGETGAWNQAWSLTLGKAIAGKTQPPVTEPADFKRLRDTTDRVRAHVNLHRYAAWQVRPPVGLRCLARRRRS